MDHAGVALGYAELMCSFFLLSRGFRPDQGTDAYPVCFGRMKTFDILQSQSSS
jgi:hypothetical protein